MKKCRVIYGILLSVFIFSCTFRKSENIEKYPDMLNDCGLSYETSELFFTDDDTLGVKLRFVYFADSINESQVDYDLIVAKLNIFFKTSRIQFKTVEIDTIVDSSIKYDMPSYQYYHNKLFKKNNCLSIYIYSNTQPNYTDNWANVAGAAGGLGSEFLAVRKAFIYAETIDHEILHCFSLKHTFIPTETKGYDIYTSDNVCDTRYISSEKEKVDKKCEFVGDDDLTPEEKEQIVCNIMSYNFSKCRTCITEGQIRKVRFYIHESPRMHELLYKGIRQVSF